MIRTARTAAAILGAALLTMGGLALGGQTPHTNEGQAPAIPRCVNDDWNDGTQDRCYTERVTDGAVLVIDHTDTVVSTGEADE